MENKARIQKVLSDQGILSRRRTEELIKEGRITVNGRPASPAIPSTSAGILLPSTANGSGSRKRRKTTM